MSDELLAAAEVACAAGDTAEVLRLAGSLASQLSENERLRWCLLLAEAGHEEAAADLGGALATAESIARLADALAEEEVCDEAPEAGDDEEPIDLRPRSGAPADAAAVASFLRFFGGRRDLYARQWFDESRRRSGYHPVREPLTETVVRAHLAGRHTIGQYVLWPDASVSFAAIDLDLSASALEALRAGHGDDVSPLRHAGLRRHALALLDAAATLGLVLYAEDSGGRGLHLWMFFEPRRPARAARMLMAQIAMAAGPQPAEVKMEIFPKQSSPGRRGLSSLVKLPLGIHRATLRPCPLLDRNLSPIADTASALAVLGPADPQLVDAVIGRRVIPLPSPELEPHERPPPLPNDATPRGLAEALRGVPPGAAERAACERVLASCPLLAGLVQKAYDRRALGADEARAIAYTLGLVGAEAGLAREILLAGGAPLKELERIRCGLPAPAGCKRLRALHAAAACTGCPSDQRVLPYPTPMLAAVGPCGAGGPRHAPFASWLEDDGDIVEAPLEAIGRILARIDGRLCRLEGARGAARQADGEGEREP